MQGAVTSFVSFAGIGAPFGFAWVFASGLREGGAAYLPGAAFLLAALLLAGAGALAFAVSRHRETR